MILQLKITLERTEPPIWRRVLVEDGMTFAGLHAVIQVAMGWEDCHLFEFRHDHFRIGIPDEYTDTDYDGRYHYLDARLARLETQILRKRQVLRYEYDFGDTWIHRIAVEKFLPCEMGVSYPCCIDGALNCPPEDCGGIWGYYDLVSTLANKSHPGRKELLEWLGEPYDPLHFDIQAVNRRLQNLGRILGSRGEEK